MPNIRRRAWRQPVPPCAAFCRPLPPSVTSRIRALHERRFMHHRHLALRQDQPPFPHRRHDEHGDHRHEQQRHERVQAVVEHQPLGARKSGPRERRSVGEEAEFRIGREDLLPAGRHGDRHEPGERRKCDPGEPLPPHLDEDRGADAQRHGAELTLAKICAIPTARDGAPPERAMSVCSPIWAASWCMMSGVTTNPAWLKTCDACARPVGVVFIAKYTPGSSVQAAIIAMTPTNDSISMPPYPMNRASDSRAIILGVVPDATSEWNPEIAPQAIVMNANGNSFPANTGPSPRLAKGVSAGILSGGRITRIARASTRIVGILRKVDRESRGQR